MKKYNKYKKTKKQKQFERIEEKCSLIGRNPPTSGCAYRAPKGTQRSDLPDPSQIGLELYPYTTSLGATVSSTNNTDRLDITEI